MSSMNNVDSATSHEMCSDLSSTRIQQVPPSSPDIEPIRGRSGRRGSQQPHTCSSTSRYGMYRSICTDQMRSLVRFVLILALGVIAIEQPNNVPKGPNQTPHTYKSHTPPLPLHHLPPRPIRPSCTSFEYVSHSHNPIPWLLPISSLSLLPFAPPSPLDEQQDLDPVEGL